MLLKKLVANVHNRQHFLHFFIIGRKTWQFPHIMIYSGKGVVFLTAVKVRDIVSVGARPVFTEQKRFTTQLRSLPLSFSSASHFISLQCVARKAACSSSGWLVWSGWEDGVCGAVCCGLRFTTGLSLRQPPPWQPAVALAKAPTRCYPYRAVCGGMHPARGRLRWDHCFYFVCFFFNFLIHSFEHSRRFLCVLVSLYGSWLSTIFVDDATWPPCQSSHLIIWAWTFRRENHPKTKTLNRQWFWISCRRGFTLSKFAQQLPVHAHVFCWQNIVTLAVEAPVANNERPRRNAGLQISLELRSPPFMDFKECLNGLESWERSAMTDERLLRYLPRERLAEWVTIPVRPSTFLKFQRDFSRL